MDRSKLMAYYQKRGFNQEVTQAACDYVQNFESWLSDDKTKIDQDVKQTTETTNISTLETTTIDTLRTYIQVLIDQDQNQLDRLLALARYFYITERNDLYLYFTSLFGALGVMDTIIERINHLHGPEMVTTIMANLEHPPLGSEPGAFPAFTKAFMTRLEANLSPEACHTVLAGNNHQIPSSAFDQEKEHFQAAATIDDYLRGYQERQVAILQDHCNQNKVWFEQTITQAVVDFAAENQEIMSAVREGDWLYTTKIPYDPDRYLKSQDTVERRYLACHCPFVREAIKDGSIPISDKWCSCSAGFAKHPYETLLGRSLPVEVLNSVLLGDEICRFRIYIGR